MWSKVMGLVFWVEIILKKFTSTGKTKVGIKQQEESLLENHKAVFEKGLVKLALLRPLYSWNQM